MMNVRKPLIEVIARSDRRAIGDAVHEMVMTNLVPQLENVRAPVLIVAADRSSRHRIKRQTETLPRRQFVVVPDTGHFVMWDDPVAFHRIVSEFLGKHR